MNYQLCVPTSSGEWLFDVYVADEAMRRVCEERGWRCELENPTIDAMGTWQFEVFSAAEKFAHKIAQSEGKTEGVWRVDVPPPMVRMPDTMVMARADVEGDAFALKLIKRPE